MMNLISAEINFYCILIENLERLSRQQNGMTLWKMNNQCASQEEGINTSHPYILAVKTNKMNHPQRNQNENQAPEAASGGQQPEHRTSICAICIEDIEIQEPMWPCRECNTEFHKSCLIRWLSDQTRREQRLTCRVCQTDMTSIINALLSIPICPLCNADCKREGSVFMACVRGKQELRCPDFRNSIYHRNELNWHLGQLRTENRPLSCVNIFCRADLRWVLEGETLMTLLTSHIQPIEIDLHINLF
ncbi:unnamed protein product [Adineta ricciae]|uniref:RING-type domain-containing protein n=1 Tax=Adineta ricciae TaxID=249248 RepID=A0A815B6V4_ADIRI|nr:unnamed protein product [Adineta ricciae]